VFDLSLCLVFVISPKFGVAKIENYFKYLMLCVRNFLLLSEKSFEIGKNEYKT